MTGSSRALRRYGWLFAAAGAAFVLASAPLTALLNRAGAFLPGSPALAGGERSLWLGLAGSMMAMIAYLAFALAEDPRQPLAWNALLLSKGVSTALFAAFSLADRNPLFLLGSAVDGAILMHLGLLRPPAAPSADQAFASRMPADERAFHEAWFAKLNDPATGDALWLRYTACRGPGESEAACWYAFFDRAAGRVSTGRWRAPLAELASEPGCPFRLGGSSLARGRLLGRREGIAWDLSWKEGAAPAFSFIPGFLPRWALGASGYEVPVSLGVFDGAFELDGRRRRFRGAPGSVGHLWGRRMPSGWLWAHAVFGAGRDAAVFELLSARLRLGPFLLPPITFAHLWRAGRHHASTGLRAALLNRVERSGETWRFEARFPGLAVEGRCRQDPALTAELDYRSPDGRRLRCRNSKTGSLFLTLVGPGGAVERGLETEDAAAVETAEEAA